jgi:hypothetical protein
MDGLPQKSPWGPELHQHACYPFNIYAVQEYTPQRFFWKPKSTFFSQPFASLASAWQSRAVAFAASHCQLNRT